MEQTGWRTVVNLLRLSILILVTVPLSLGVRDRAVARRDRAALDAQRPDARNLEALHQSLVRWSVR